MKPNYNAPTAKRIQRKQKSRVQVYRLAFYSVELHGEVYMASYFSTLHFDIFLTTSQLVVPTLICKPKTRCTITTVPKLICIPERTKRDDVTATVYQSLDYIYFDKHRQGSYHANKQTKSTQFILHRTREYGHDTLGRGLLEFLSYLPCKWKAKYSSKDLVWV